MDNSKRTINTAEMERIFGKQFAERKERLLSVLTEDDSPTISASKLSAALGISGEQITNAAWSGHLPVGWAFRGVGSTNRRTTIFKDKVWLWLYGGAEPGFNDCVNQK